MSGQLTLLRKWPVGLGDGPIYLAYIFHLDMMELPTTLALPFC